MVVGRWYYNLNGLSLSLNFEEFRKVIVNNMICQLAFLLTPILSPVLSLHSVAGGGADVHPSAVLEIFCGAPPAVGPQLHHGRVGPVL